MDPSTAALWAGLSGALVALVWALVRRVRRAKRLMPRGRFRLQLSLRTPESEPPTERTARRVFRREPMSMEDPSMSDPPIDVDAVEIIDEPKPPREPLSERPTPDTKPRRPKR